MTSAGRHVHGLAPWKKSFWPGDRGRLGPAAAGLSAGDGRKSTQMAWDDERRVSWSTVPADNLPMILSALLVLTLQATAPAGAAPAQPVRLGAAEIDSLTRAIEKDRE